MTSLAFLLSFLSQHVLNKRFLPYSGAISLLGEGKATMESRNWIPHLLSCFTHFVLFSVLKTRHYIFNINGDMKHKTHRPLRKHLRANKSLNRLLGMWSGPVNCIKIMYAPNGAHILVSSCISDKYIIFQQPFKYRYIIHCEFHMYIQWIVFIPCTSSNPSQNHPHSSTPSQVPSMVCFFVLSLQCVMPLGSHP